MDWHAPSFRSKDGIILRSTGQEQSGVMHRRQSYKKQCVWNEVRPLSIKREMHIVNLDSSTKDCVVRNIPIIHCSSRPTETGPRSTLDFTVANHRKQNCHEADCFYCMSQAAQNGWRGSNAEGSLSSSDQEDKYPQVSATFPVYGQSSPHPTLSSVQSQHAHQRAEVDMTQGGGHTPKAHNPFSPTSSLSTGSREKNTIQVNMGDTHTTSTKLSRNGVQLSKKHSHQNGLITQMEPLFVLKNGDFDDTNTPGSTSTNSTKSNVFVSSLGCIESRSRLKAGEAYEQYGTTATVSVLADEEATLSCTAHREPVAPAFELTYVKPVSIVSTCTMNTNPNLSQNEIASPNYPALVSKFGVEHSKSPHTNSHPAAAATYVLQSVDEIKSTRALSSNQQLDITHSSPLTAELDVSDGVGTSVGTYGVPKRAMSQTNMQTTRSWNLRSQHQGSETDLAFKRVTSVSQPPGRSGYSAHRERLRQEREQELLMRQHRQRQLAASTTGLNEQHLHRHQQQYRSLSAVNTTGGTDAFEEVETIILQPIGRGVQDIDSRTGSMTTLHRGPTGSMMEGGWRVRGDARYGSMTRIPTQRIIVRNDQTRSTLPPAYGPRARSASPGLSPSRLAAGSYVSSRPSHRMSPARINSRGSQDIPTRSPLPPAIRSPRPVLRNGSPSYLPYPAGGITVTNHSSSTEIPKIPSQYSLQRQQSAIERVDRGRCISRSPEILQSGRSTHSPPPVRLSDAPCQTGLISHQHPQHQEQSQQQRWQQQLHPCQNRSHLMEIQTCRQEQQSSEKLMLRTLKELEILERELRNTETQDSSLHRVDDQHQRNGLVRRGYSSTQYLNRNTSNTDLSRPLAVHQSHATIVPATTMQSLQNSRYDTTSTLVNNTQTAQFSGSRSHLTNTSSSTLAPAQATTVPNGWKTETTKRTYIDGTETNPLSLVQETAPLWYRPHLSRDAAISILRQQPPGSFLIRDSTTFKGAFGLAVKVATLPPKVTPKSDDLQAELVRHYLIEVINTVPRGVRLKGFASEPVFPSLAALIHEHTIDQLALPCKLILPPGPTNLPSSGTGALPHLVVGTIVNSDALMVDNATVTSAGSLLGPTASDSGSVQMDSTHQIEEGNTVPIHATEAPATSTHNVPLVCVLRESAAHQRRSPMDMNTGQGLTFRCLMLGSVDSAQWGKDLCFARAVDQLIPLTQLTAAECDHGVSRVRYTEVQLRVSAHDGITIIDLLRRLFLRRHLPNHVLLFCGLETRKKEFLHPEHQAQGIVNPKIFGIVVRKGITEYTTHVFSECDPAHPAESIVQHIRTTYPHLMSK